MGCCGMAMSPMEMACFVNSAVLCTRNCFMILVLWNSTVLIETFKVEAISLVD